MVRLDHKHLLRRDGLKQIVLELQLLCCNLRVNALQNDDQVWVHLQRPQSFQLTRAGGETLQHVAPSLGVNLQECSTR